MENAAAKTNCAVPFGTQVMAKPTGSRCNLGCAYCFYLEKERLYRPSGPYRMLDAVLEKFVREYIEIQDAPEVDFAWQGGEPTLAGLEFFRKVIQLQNQYSNGKSIHNSLQTNGILLDDAWGAFLAENRFLVGISIDGPRRLHDVYRVDRQGRPTFNRVMQGLEALKRHKVEFNTLTVVHRKNSLRPLEVYRFLKQIGSQFIQFIPLVERLPDARARQLGLDHAAPPTPGQAGDSPPVTDWSVRPEDYGRFLARIFQHWVRNDVGRTFVYLFEFALAAWAGKPVSLCVFQPHCGNATALEHNGDLYACDHYVYPEYRLGNLLEEPLKALIQSPRQRKFGADKFDTLPQYCRDCEFLFACYGECPKHRFVATPEGEPGLNYLCEGYKHYFKTIARHMQAMTELIQSGRPAAAIMEILAKNKKQKGGNSPRPKDPCPCGSGRQYRKCCRPQKR